MSENGYIALHNRIIYIPKYGSANIRGVDQPILFSLISWPTLHMQESRFKKVRPNKFGDLMVKNGFIDM